MQEIIFNRKLGQKLHVVVLHWQTSNTRLIIFHDSVLVICFAAEMPLALAGPCATSLILSSIPIHTLSLGAKKDGTLMYWHQYAVLIFALRRSVNWPVKAGGQDVDVHQIFERRLNSTEDVSIDRLALKSCQQFRTLGCGRLAGNQALTGGFFHPFNASPLFCNLKSYLCIGSK